MGTHYEDLPISQLVIHPKNIRKEVGVVVDLANSISAKGLLQPLVVAPAVPSGSVWTQAPSLSPAKYVIIGGHRRHAAAQLAGLDVVPCVIREDLVDEGAQLEAMLVENTQRNDLTVTEEAEAFQALLEFPGYTVKSIAKGVGRSQKLVRDRLALTKLPDEAKAKLEDRTLTIEHAMELVEFQDNEQATQRLIEAAGTRNWDYELKIERRRREAPAKLEHARADLAAAGITPLDENDYAKLSKYQRIYGNGPLTVKEHVAAGHVCTVSEAWGDINWYEKPAAAPKAKKEPLTPEQVEEARRLGEITAGLTVAAEVRAEHLAAAVKNPPKDAATLALRDLIMDEVYRQWDDMAPLLQLPDAEHGEKQELLRAAVEKLNVEQLALLLHIIHKSHEDELRRPKGWDLSKYGSGTVGYKWGPGHWIDTLQAVYGYALSDMEREALDFFGKPASDDDADPGACTECGEDADDGEGWDGLCGNCADVAEAS